MFAGAQATHKAVVDAAEQFFFFVCNTNQRELLYTMEVVDEARIFKLVDFVENDDSSGAFVLLEPIDKFVVRSRLPVDIDRRADIV